MVVKRPKFKFKFQTVDTRKLTLKIKYLKEELSEEKSQRQKERKQYEERIKSLQSSFTTELQILKDEWMRKEANFISKIEAMENTSLSRVDEVKNSYERQLQEMK